MIFEVPSIYNTLISGVYQDVLKDVKKGNGFDFTSERLKAFRQVFKSIAEFNRKQVIDGAIIERLMTLISLSDASTDFNRLQASKLTKLILENFSSVSRPIIQAMFKRIMGYLPKSPSCRCEGVLSSSDVETLFEIKRQNHPERSFVVITSVDYNKLEDHIRVLQDKPEDVQLWIITQPMRFSTHVMLLYMQKIQNEWIFMVTDSIGIRTPEGEVGSYPIELIKKLRSAVPQSKIYLFDHIRQFDRSSCSIFSLNDVIKFTPETKEKVFAQLFTPIHDLSDQAWKNLTDDEKEGVYTFKFLPAQMMNLTQSFKALSKYHIDYPLESTQLIHRLDKVKKKDPCNAENLNQKTERFSYWAEIKNETKNVTEFKKVNLHSDYKYAKSLIRLLDQELARQEIK